MLIKNAGLYMYISCQDSGIRNLYIDNLSEVKQKTCMAAEVYYYNNW